MRARVSVIHWHCTAQLSMFNMEKRYRNKIIIIIIIIRHYGQTDVTDEEDTMVTLMSQMKKTL